MCKKQLREWGSSKWVPCYASDKLSRTALNSSLISLGNLSPKLEICDGQEGVNQVKRRPILLIF